MKTKANSMNLKLAEPYASYRADASSLPTVDTKKSKPTKIAVPALAASSPSLPADVQRTIDQLLFPTHFTISLALDSADNIKNADAGIFWATFSRKGVESPLLTTSRVDGDNDERLQGAISFSESSYRTEFTFLLDPKERFVIRLYRYTYHVYRKKGIEELYGTAEIGMSDLVAMPRHYGHTDNRVELSLDPGSSNFDYIGK